MPSLPCLLSPTYCCHSPTCHLWCPGPSTSQVSSSSRQKGFWTLHKAGELYTPSLVSGGRSCPSPPSPCPPESQCTDCNKCCLQCMGTDYAAGLNQHCIIQSLNSVPGLHCTIDFALPEFSAMLCCVLRRPSPSSNSPAVMQQQAAVRQLLQCPAQHHQQQTRSRRLRRCW